MPILKHNRLLALEQALHPTADKDLEHKLPRHKRRRRNPKSGPPSDRRLRRSRVKARAFDWDEPIELTYNGDTDSYVPSSKTYGAASADQDEAESFEVEAFALGNEDEVESFEVEAFEQDEDEDLAASKVQNGAGSQSFSAVDLDDEALAEDLDFSDLDAALEQNQPSRALSDNDFAADLQAILSGEKTYDRDRGGMVRAKRDRDDDNWSAASQAEVETAPPAPETEPHPHEMFSRMSQHMPHNQMGSAPLAEAKSQPAEAEAEARPHDVFDRMGHNMSYATSFDLGSISLEQRFDEFDVVLANEERTRSTAKSVQLENESNSQGVSASLALDEATLEEDLALMHKVRLQSNEERSDTQLEADLELMNAAMAKTNINLEEESNAAKETSSQQSAQEQEGIETPKSQAEHSPDDLPANEDQTAV